MTERVVARLDPSLGARVVARTPLSYRDGPSARDDRPAHVRAGSGITWFAGKLAVVQDDTSFIALIDPETRTVMPLTLPWHPGGVRQFDDVRGNKADKLDFEACVTLTAGGEETLLAFGSGSTAVRERVAVVRHLRDGSLDARVVAVPRLYAALRSERAFAGSELNVEGVFVRGDRVAFVQRGNGKPAEGTAAIDAIASVSLETLSRTLSGAGQPEFRVEDVVQYVLGSLDGVRLTFTDAAAAPSGRVAYLATAEASPDAVRDGPVSGSVIGVIDASGARAASIVGADGSPIRDKVEGIVLHARDPRRAYVVIDADDPARPSELCEVELVGFPF